MGGETTNASGVGFGNIQPQTEGKINVNTAMGINAAGNLGNMALDAWKTSLNYDLMSSMIGLQRDQMTAYYTQQGKLVDLQSTLIGSQEKVQIKQLTTTKEIAELQKEQNVAIAKTKADAAVKIAKINALNSQFYGQPSQVSSSSLG